MEDCMKKVFIITGLMALGVAAVYAADTVKYSGLFINKFYHCLPTNQSLTLTDGEGIEYTLTRSLHGWKNKQCIYRETVTKGEEKTSYNCGFYREQVNEIVSAMREDPNGESTAETTWSRFKNNPGVCIQPAAEEE